MLRIFLPPNLASAAPRNAIAVRAEIDLAAVPDPELLPALALLQQWCPKPTSPAFLQLSRQQLRQLIERLAGRPVFFWANAPQSPLLWVGPLLRGVSDLLNEPSPPASTPAPASARPRTREDASSPPLTVDGSEHFLAITLPSREHVSYAPALELLKAHGFSLEPSNRKWWLRDRHKVLSFLAANYDRLRTEFHADFTANFEKNTAHLQPAEIVCDASEAPDGFSVTLGLRAGRIPEDQLLAAASSSRGYVEASGRIYLIAPEQLRQLSRAQRALAGDSGQGLAGRRTHRVSTARLAEAEQIIESVAPHFQPPEAWRQRSLALRDLTRLQPVSLPPTLDQLLRPYQKVGAAWLAHLHRHGLGGILADEMGLGKTVQALAFLTSLHAQPRQPPSLVVCPASLVENWRRETNRFAPALRLFLHHGANRLTRPADFGAHDLIITSYGTLARDRDLFASVNFACLIADEAQHVKNRRSQNAQALRALQATGRILLTGTPVENSLDDLRSLFELLMPGYLDRVPAGTRGDERVWYDERLRAKTAPYILRRTKQAVAPELPPKLEQVIYCELTPAQAALYRQLQEHSERALLDLEASGASENALRLAALTQLLRLRQICCDPRLLPQTATQPSPDDSAKLEALRELLDEAIDDGHRVLIFSQFTSLLALLRDELNEQGIVFCYLDGSMTPRARQAEVDRFNQSPDVPVFLISLKAGGTGLNLTAADVVVHFDPWWNPAVEAQATDRAHRIGQTRVVTSYKLICSGTVEEKVLQLQETKRALLSDVFEASDAASAKISLADLRTLLTG